jgi:urease accessory protein
VLRAVTIVRKAAVKAGAIVDRITLDHEARQRRRIAVRSDTGSDFLIDLEKASTVRDGDALRLEDGGLLIVKAAAEPLLEIKAENPLRLLRVAWHIGNRHTPAEITADAIYLTEDHVLATMVRGLGCSVRRVMRAFQPEPGAYAGHDSHAHDHGAGDHVVCPPTTDPAATS